MVLQRPARCSAVAALAIVAFCGIAGAAPAPQLQPLAAQFEPEAKGYAVGYGYGGVQAPVAAVQVGAAVGKTVHYADQPAVVGYAPSVYESDLSAYAAASFPQVEQLRRFNPGFRPVHTVVPKVTAVEPSVTVHKTYVDVPVVHEYHRPQLVHVRDPSAYYNYQLVDRRK